MEADFWKEIIGFIEDTTNIVKPLFNEGDLSGVEHYLKYDEYEMAFEGLFITIMKLENAPAIDFVESNRIAILLKLDEESVFDENFWIKFEKYVSDNTEGKQGET